MKIQHIEASDYFQVSKIYLEGIATGVATFQTDSPTWEEWDNSHLSYCRLAMINNKKYSVELHFRRCLRAAFTVA